MTGETSLSLYICICDRRTRLNTSRVFVPEVFTFDTPVVASSIALLAERVASCTYLEIRVIFDEDQRDEETYEFLDSIMAYFGDKPCNIALMSLADYSYSVYEGFFKD